MSFNCAYLGGFKQMYCMSVVVRSGHCENRHWVYLAKDAFEIFRDLPFSFISFGHFFFSFIYLFFLFLFFSKESKFVHNMSVFKCQFLTLAICVQCESRFWRWTALVWIVRIEPIFRIPQSECEHVCVSVWMVCSMRNFCQCAKCGENTPKLFRADIDTADACCCWINCKCLSNIGLRRRWKSHVCWKDKEIDSLTGFQNEQWSIVKTTFSLRGWILCVRAIVNFLWNICWSFSELCLSNPVFFCCDLSIFLHIKWPN